MKKNESMMGPILIGSMALLGYKMMICNEEVKKNMKNMAKSALKNMYKKLDEMD